MNKEYYEIRQLLSDAQHAYHNIRIYNSAWARGHIQTKITVYERQLRKLRNEIKYRIIKDNLPLTTIITECPNCGIENRFNYIDIKSGTQTITRRCHCGKLLRLKIDIDIKYIVDAI